MSTLNLGIVAHVDAGKTTLTERLLYAAGVIDEIGRVDDGSTQTDTLALERARGITIKAAVVSFVAGDVAVNLIDTPGHPDFIAEVERVLGVLDGAVLVVSAVEGVQAQTRVLMRALRRLRVPTLIFVNKTDRAGARTAAVLDAVRAKLTPAAGPVDLGVAALLEALADHDDALLHAYLDDRPVAEADLRRALAAQTARARVHPVLFGSARTGAGVEELMAAIAELLPAAAGDPDGPLAGTVFKIERGAGGEKVAYVRLRSGTIRARDRVPIGDRSAGKVTAIEIVERGGATPARAVGAGRIAKLWGLADARIGDAVGAAPADDAGHTFSPPTLEAVVASRRAADRGALRAALGELAEQDPLIGLRYDEARGELGLMPFAFFRAVEESVRDALRSGLHGWEVTDCAVTMTHSGYAARQSHAHGTFDKSMSSTAGDFRSLAPTVLRRALRQADTVVEEPIQRFDLETPADALGAVLPVLGSLGATPALPVLRGPVA